MVHAWVRYSVLDCNVFKTKCRDPAPRSPRTLGAAMPGLEATAALPLMYSGKAAWLGHATRYRSSTPGASIDGAEACTELSAFVTYVDT